MIRTAVVGSLIAALASEPVPSRSVEGPAAVQWPEQAEPEERAELEPEPPASTPPPPSAARPEDGRVLRVAVGLDPSAPGSKAERALVDQLADSSRAASGPRAEPRRLRVGAPSAREVCREGRDDLVLMIGYVGERPEPVVLGYDCSLDLPFAVRGAAAAAEPDLVPSLWAEHDAMVRDGVQEQRRRGRLGPRARAGIAAGVALAVVGVAVGLLVANALREEVVVLKVGP